MVRRMLFVLATIMVAACSSSPTAPSLVSPVATVASVAKVTFDALTTEEKNFIMTTNINHYGSGRMVVRWPEGVPIRVYADANFHREKLVNATKFWENLTGGKVTFQIVDNPEQAQVLIERSIPLGLSETSCGVEGPNTFNNGIILSGLGYIAMGLKPNCSVTSEEFFLTHGLGHILGLWTHTSDGLDVMSGANNPGIISSGLLDHSINWMYSVPPASTPLF